MKKFILVMICFLSTLSIHTSEGTLNLEKAIRSAENRDCFYEIVKTVSGLG